MSHDGHHRRPVGRFGPPGHRSEPGSREFVRLTLRPNGHALEQVLSPLVVHTSPLHTEPTALAPGDLVVRAGLSG